MFITQPPSLSSATLTPDTLGDHFLTQWCQACVLAGWCQDPQNSNDPSPDQIYIRFLRQTSGIPDAVAPIIQPLQSASSRSLLVPSFTGCCGHSLHGASCPVARCPREVSKATGLLLPSQSTCLCRRTSAAGCEPEACFTYKLLKTHLASALPALRVPLPGVQFTCRG